jgi:hypothetical protein
VSHAFHTTLLCVNTLTHDKNWNDVVAKHIVPARNYFPSLYNICRELNIQTAANTMRQKTPMTGPFNHPPALVSQVARFIWSDMKCDRHSTPTHHQTPPFLRSTPPDYYYQNEPNLRSKNNKSFPRARGHSTGRQGRDRRTPTGGRVPGRGQWSQHSGLNSNHP